MSNKTIDEIDKMLIKYFNLKFDLIGGTSTKTSLTRKELVLEIQALITEAVERHVRIVQGCISEACSTDDDTDIDDVNEIIEYVRDNPNNYIESNGGIQLNKELL